MTETTDKSSMAATDSSDQNGENGGEGKASQFTDRKGTQLGEALEEAGEKVEGMKTRMEDRYVETVSPAIEDARGQMTGAARYLQENTAKDYLRDLEDFARQHPRITAGVSAFLGWKIGRALKFFK